MRLDLFADHEHTFTMAAGRSLVADEAIARIAAWLRDRLDLAER